MLSKIKICVACTLAGIALAMDGGPSDDLPLLKRRIEQMDAQQKDERIQRTPSTGTLHRGTMAIGLDYDPKALAEPDVEPPAASDHFTKLQDQGKITEVSLPKHWLTGYPSPADFLSPDFRIDVERMEISLLPLKTALAPYVNKKVTALMDARDGKFKPVSTSGSLPVARVRIEIHDGDQPNAPDKAPGNLSTDAILGDGHGHGLSDGDMLAIHDMLEKLDAQDGAVRPIAYVDGTSGSPNTADAPTSLQDDPQRLPNISDWSDSNRSFALGFRKPPNAQARNGRQGV